MTFHNYAEEEVLAKVAEVFASERASGAGGFCACELCRLDVACYVLNRYPPQYQTSGRGLAHRQSDYSEKLQRDADLAALIYRGIQQINHARRPHAAGEAAGQAEVPQGMFFNFPQIVGRLIHSTGFIPLAGLCVRLLSESGRELPMADGRWTNPCLISDQTPGVYSFWPLPERAGPGEGERSWEMKVAVDDSSFQPLRHYFTVKTTAEDGWLSYTTGRRVMTLPDLFLVPL
jgi:competence protein ComFB